jgi:nitrogen fixation/metabolism regulation signal transduction histidine kinase
MDLKPDRPKLVKIQLYGELKQLSLLSNIFKVEAQTFKLVSFQNIKNELEAGEVDAWQKIIRVLTHEIMNSITPITSLSDTLVDIVGPSNEKQLPLDKDSVAKLFIGLKAIKERSAGLKTFSKAYQSLTRLPVPEFATINSHDFLETIRVLVSSELQASKILLETTVEPSDHSFLADSEQITQVVLNLVKNSKEAILETEDKPDGKITVSIVGKEGQTDINIHDNGPGISDEFREKIFIPFFTTKKKGSGIGLALARQIIRQHNGTIQLDSDGENGTTARISL